MAQVQKPHAVTASSPPLPDGNVKSNVIEQPKFLPHWDQADLCSSPGNANYLLIPRKRRKDDNLSTTLRAWIVDHQIGLSINLLLLLSLVHICFPRARRRTTTFFSLSYYDASSDSYRRGPDDFYFVASWIVIFTGLRAAALQYVLLPFAQWTGLQKPKTKVRFAEQAWLFIYGAVFWSLGMYVFSTSKYFLNFSELWTDFPAILMPGALKWYYLVQFAFWLQQIIVVNIEERRSDHWQMFTHHIVTSLLILFSYGYYQQRVGNVILCLMDAVDIALPVVKMLNYTGYQTICDIFFCFFILIWVVARHILYLRVVWSIHTDVPRLITYGCYDSSTSTLLATPSLSAGPHANMQNYDPDFATNYGTYGTSDILSNLVQSYTNPGGTMCYHAPIRHSFIALLLFLQGILLLWLVLILRIAWRVIRGDGAEDARSDDEEGEEERGEVIEEAMEQAPSSVSAQAGASLSAHVLPPATLPLSKAPIEIEAPLEEYVGVEGLSLKSRGSGRGTPRAARAMAAGRSKRGATSTGSSFMGHSDRKELLGRIGCDKPVGVED